MSLRNNDDQCSDEEVFIGQLSLKEIKKHILWNNHHHSKKYYSATSKEGYENDIKIIETHSAPDLLNTENISTSQNISSSSLSPLGPEVYSDWELKPVDDSFLKVEKMVADLCVSPKKVLQKVELNNTLDIIDYILNNGAPESTVPSIAKQPEEAVLNETPKIELNVPDADYEYTKILPKGCTEIESDRNIKSFTPAYITPTKDFKCQKSEKNITPLAAAKQNTPIFKTPASVLSVKKPSASTLKKTPMKSNAYPHIVSPVASYIKNCSESPLAKQIRLIKPLPGISSIPKFVKNGSLNKPSNKENVNFPSVAYKSAKKTEVINLADGNKLPQSQLMKKTTSSLPKPLIMKHNHRNINLAKRLCHFQEDSFDDLSMRQADVSKCTQ